MGYGLPWVIKLCIMWGGIPGEDLSSSGISVTTASVVGTMAAIEAGQAVTQHAALLPSWPPEVEVSWCQPPPGDS